MPQKGVVSWNVMITGLALNGKGQHGVKLFEEMVDKGTNPNNATFVGVLACCAHASLVEKGRGLFASTMSRYLIKLNQKLRMHC
ncbi:Pentatricopeptide repeat [Trema orientale]|uniref:Pentatricopeptide repeat n=1 Tax=Trema orientale TaxID=63057 RepID=A0A2P5EVD5_TREOI|nr:Pentatricopeptide repeat [Trema orientale]